MCYICRRKNLKKVKRKISDYIVLAVKGVCMGAADVIPGVSGGTIAFLTGIYAELINSIKSINGAALKKLLSFDIAGFWRSINGNFLISVFAGILISVFSLAKLMQYLLVHHPVEVWSFFFGLIVASAIYVLREVDKWKLSYVISAVFGIAAAAWICMVTPGETTDALWFVFVSGMIAICAMILPGISGSFILLLMGKYAFIMKALTDFDIPVIVVFGLGALIGIIAFSHFLSWLLSRFYMQTICVLSGFMIGSLIKVWPWKQVLGDGFDRPVLPSVYEMETGNSSELAYAVLFGVIGVALVFTIELVVKYMKSHKS